MNDLENNDSDVVELNRQQQKPEKKQSHVSTVVLYILSMSIIPIVLLFLISIVRGSIIAFDLASQGMAIDENVLAEMIANELTTLNAIAMFLSYVIICIFILVKYRRTLGEEIRKLNISQLLLKVFGYGMFTFVVNVIVGNITLLITQESAANQEAVNSMLTSSFFITAFMVIIMAPIVEEVVFRYIIQNWGYKMGAIGGIALSTILFAFVHVAGEVISIIFMPEYSVIQLVSILPYIALGLCFGITYYRTKNLALTMGVHMFNNAISVLVSVLAVFFQ